MDESLCQWSFGKTHRCASPTNAHWTKCDDTWLTRCSIEIDCETAIIVMSRGQSHQGKINYHFTAVELMFVRASHISCCGIATFVTVKISFFSFHWCTKCACAKMFGMRSLLGWARPHLHTHKQLKSARRAISPMPLLVCTQSLNHNHLEFQWSFFFLHLSLSKA